jgi:hypothetical protein
MATAALESSPQDELERAIQVFLARQQEEEEENAEQDKSAQRRMEDTACVACFSFCSHCIAIVADLGNPLDSALCSGPDRGQASQHAEKKR